MAEILLLRKFCDILQDRLSTKNPLEEENLEKTYEGAGEKDNSIPGSL